MLGLTFGEQGCCMGDSTIRPRVYRFGLFELSVEAGELRKNGVRLKLQDQPLQILCALLERPGEIVTREQLRQQLWPEGTFVDFEHGLNTAVKKIRDVLSDDADIPRYIETVPRKGYRFIGTLAQNGIQAVAAPPPSSPRAGRSRTALLVAGLAFVIVIAALGFRGLAPATRLEILATRQLTFGGDVAPYSTIETDGRRVYYVKYSDGRLYSVSVGGGPESSSLTRFRDPVVLHISPDGSTLLVREMVGPAGELADRIWLLPTNGGPARPLGDIEGQFAAWAPDGKTIAFARQNTVYLTDDQGAVSRRLADVPGAVSWIRWSPDGRRLRLTVQDTKTDVLSIWEAGRNGTVRPVAMDLDKAVSACCGIWTKDRRHFLFRLVRDERADFWVTGDGGWSLRSAKPSLLSAGGVSMIAAAASPLENTLLGVGHENSRMAFKYDLAHRQLTRFLPELSVANPAFSPDGKWMTLSQVHTGQRVLWRVQSDGREWLQLTDAQLSVHHSRISPDGKRIALMAKWLDQPWKVYWVAAEGGALHELNVPVASQADANWMPDNDSILFGQPPRFFSEPDSPRAIYLHNLQSGSLSKLAGTEGWFSPRLSPDAQGFLALSIDEHKLALYDFASSKWRLLLQSGEKRLVGPFWSPDGQWAYVTTYGRDQHDSLMRIRVRDGFNEEVLSFRDMIASPECWGWGFAPDGSLIVNCTRPNSNIYAMRYE
jgi:Tol biopolymer transport system component/DNA-binding winged helix-turn-helix (wHTH) protein